MIGNEDHIKDIYESLRVEFKMGMRGAKLVSLEEFQKSIQDHMQVIVGLTEYKMDCIAPDAVPQSLLDDLKRLFYELKVVPPKEKQGKPPEERPKLVAVSKTLHFLLPDLIMPIDRAIVLRFLRKKNIPSDTKDQYALLIEVFNKYLELTAKLGLKQSNGDDNWWNRSVPKRIDNAIAGFWKLFDDNNMEHIICGNIDMFLEYLKWYPVDRGRGYDSNLSNAQTIEVKPESYVRKAGFRESDTEMSSDNHVVKGSVYFTEGRWEIGYFDAQQIRALPYDKYPFVPGNGIKVKLVINGIQYGDSASFHHYKGRKCVDSYIGSATVRIGISQPLMELLNKHSLDVHPTPVLLTFVGDTVHIEKIVERPTESDTLG